MPGWNEETRKTAESAVVQLKELGGSAESELYRLGEVLAAALEEIETRGRWSRRWKALAQFRGWPASRHEKNRQRIKELEEALQGLLGILDSSRGAMVIGALHGEGLASKEESAMADTTITKARALCSEGEGK